MDTALSSAILHSLWEIIEETQTHALIQLEDQELIRGVLHQMQQRRSLSDHERFTVTQYLYQRRILIRELAAARRGVVLPA
ncbi:hypothetical protein [Lyngbya confervoides]|uniref:Uncharacterized protein n=1 Tax=Lyngbya confervoides BDU141951 TaxID=1574623 RepID=A0ABD4TB99_9CYAN|nr:hypothetical protein [Lyngbya confervoides]MCM1985395.1 hypothetical protein [Lyngbya confervoides BDU141951]